MIKHIAVALAVICVSGCSFVFQDGDIVKRHYGIRGDDAVSLAQMISSARAAQASTGLQPSGDSAVPAAGQTQPATAEPQPLKIK